jgi:LuxR family maltose regulon positive regulatory protein
MPQAHSLRPSYTYPRWRPSLVSRPRLMERLDRASEHRLTLVSAPAGFGKTTLLAEWLAQSGHGERLVAWLSLDEGDNHPARFWAYVIAALRTVQPTLGESALSLLQSPQPTFEAALASLLNEIGAAPRELMLVLDDYHLIEAKAIHDGIAFLLDHMPPHMHLVMTSRADPPLPLARLRGRGDLTEVRAADLRFAPEEAAAFLKQATDLDLSDENLSTLEAKTEGWIAGLQLAALSMRGREDVDGFVNSLAGDDRYIVDYLVEEVLERQPASVRRFLLMDSGRACC